MSGAQLTLQGRFTIGVAAQSGFTAVPEGLRAQLRVRVGGEAFRTVVACDTWAGWADVIARDAGGQPLEHDGMLQLRREYGRVEAVLLAPGCDDVDVLQRGGLVLG